MNNFSDPFCSFCLYAVKTIFLCALVITSGVSGCTEFQPSSDALPWQLQSEADYYLSNPDPSLGYKTLKAPINFASLNEAYRAQSAKVSELTKSCREWVVLEVVSLSTQSVTSKWLCEGGPSQGAGEFGVANGKGFFKTLRLADVGIIVSTTANEFSRSKPIDFSRFTALDASAVFVTINRNGVFRRARYDANAGHFDSDYPESRNGQDTAFDEAYLHFLESFEFEG